MIYNCPALLSVDTSTHGREITPATPGPTGGRTPAKPPPQSAGKTEGPARHRHGREPRHLRRKTPGPRAPALLIFRSNLPEDGRRTETRSAAPAPAGPANGKQGYFLKAGRKGTQPPRHYTSASAHGKNHGKKLDPSGDQQERKSRKVGRRERTCRPSPSFAHIAKRPPSQPAAQPGQRQRSRRASSRHDQHRAQPPRNKKAPPLLYLNHRAIAPTSSSTPATMATPSQRRHDANTWHPFAIIRRDFIQITTPATGNTATTKKQGKGKGRGGL